ncbi:unnamed protein product [Symbiodinium sp. KB8]|nr:unnamed protein product [Symbiodinium sp. KB8]
MGEAFCCDAILVSLLTRTGQPQPGTAAHHGAMLRVAEWRKRAAYPPEIRSGSSCSAPRWAGAGTKQRSGSSETFWRAFDGRRIAVKRHLARAKINPSISRIPMDSDKAASFSELRPPSGTGRTADGIHLQGDQRDQRWAKEQAEKDARQQPPHATSQHA